MKWMRNPVCLVLIAILLFQGGMASAAKTSGGLDKTTVYRLYQKDRIIMEFIELNKAIAYGKSLQYSHVEKIKNREWIWDNFPKFKVYYNNGVSEAKLEFHTQEQAIKAASALRSASVRDLHGAGWIWNNYSMYRLYQGDRTKPEWGFTDLNLAKKEAKKYANAHIIELAGNKWIWDNLTPAQKKAEREGTVKYRLEQNGKTKEGWSFSYLEDAVKESQRWADTDVIRIDTGAVVHSTRKAYQLLQGDKLLKTYRHIHDAIRSARVWRDSRIMLNGNEIWTSVPYYGIYQGNRLIGSRAKLAEALQFAKGYQNTSIVTADGVPVWNNALRQLFGGWTGTASVERIQEQVGRTMGLDLVMPSWFYLGDETGALKDSSSPDLAQQLMDRGFRVQPLIHNQFDDEMTSKFLHDPKAVDAFITALTERCAELGVEGMNLDFEEMNAEDRTAYTAFVQKLAHAAHANKLKVTIDLPRGDIKWNHLTAFDHAAIAAAVDHVMIMAYDQHYSGSSKPGPVSALAWAEQGVKDFLSYGIERKKLILGVPFYTREWTLDANGDIAKDPSGKKLTRAVYMKDIPTILASASAVKTWDESAGMFKVEYTDNGVRKVFWLEDETTVKARLAIAKKYDLAGISAWRLNYEPSTPWNGLLPLK